MHAKSAHIDSQRWVALKTVTLSMCDRHQHHPTVCSSVALLAGASCCVLCAHTSSAGCAFTPLPPTAPLTQSRIPPLNLHTRACCPAPSLPHILTGAPPGMGRVLRGGVPPCKPSSAWRPEGRQRHGVQAERTGGSHDGATSVCQGGRLWEQQVGVKPGPSGGLLDICNVCASAGDAGQPCLHCLHL